MIIITKIQQPNNISNNDNNNNSNNNNNNNNDNTANFIWKRLRIQIPRVNHVHLLCYETDCT